MKITIEEFGEKVLEVMNRNAEYGREMYICRNRKNNGIVKVGIAMKDPPDGISPCIYINEYHERYTEGVLTIEQAAGCICRQFDAMGDKALDFDTEDFLCWEKMKPMIRGRLVNTAMNQEFLGTAPSRPFLDLSLTYHIRFCSFRDNCYVRISNAHLNLWGKTEEDLYRAAMENIYAEEISCFGDIEEFITNLAADIQDDLEETPCPCDGLWIPGNSLQMYVLTNSDRTYGASLAANSGILHGIHDRIGDFILLPCSVHEVIIIPDRMSNYEEFASMVRELNESEVLPEERLSDHVYIYDGVNRKLRIAA